MDDNLMHRTWMCNSGGGFMARLAVSGWETSVATIPSADDNISLPRHGMAVPLGRIGEGVVLHCLVIAETRPESWSFKSDRNENFVLAG